MSMRAAVVLLAAALAFPGMAPAKRCGPGDGCRAGGGMAGHGQGGGGGHEDHRVFHYLIAHRDQIRRTVSPRPDGVVTVTESADPAVRDAIRTHVRAMKARLAERRPIHARDPLFAALFRHAGAIDLEIDETAQGVRVTETSADPWVVQLIQAHAAVVDGFLARGLAEVHRDHPVPARP